MLTAVAFGGGRGRRVEGRAAVQGGGRRTLVTVSGSRPGEIRAGGPPTAAHANPNGGGRQPQFLLATGGLGGAGKSGGVQRPTRTNPIPPTARFWGVAATGAPFAGITTATMCLMRGSRDGCHSLFRPPISVGSAREAHQVFRVKHNTYTRVWVRVRPIAFPLRNLTYATISFSCENKL